MLAQPTKRQHTLPQHHASASTSTSTSTILPPSPAHSFNYNQLPQQFAAQQFFDQKLLHDYLESQQQSFGAPAASAPDSFMTSAYYANPAIRVQQSTPTPHFSSNAFNQQSMLSSTATASGRDSWASYGNAQGQSLQTPSHSQQRGHQRASSSSSVGSGVSQYQPVASSNNFPTFSNHLPTPTPTPTQDSFMSQSNFNNFTHNAGMDQTMAAHMSMKQALMESQGEDVPDFAHSARQSVSSYGHDSPATPHTAQGEDGDFKMPANETRQQPIVPKFERTYTDIAADNFYDPNAATVQPVAKNKPAQSSLLSPYRSNANENVQRALQAAQYARSQSPTSTASRGDSPFRKGSPYCQPSSNFNSPMVNTASATREKNRRADAAYAMKSQMQSRDDAQPKTISPKDALLDFGEPDEDSKVSLFPETGAGEFDVQYSGCDQSRNATQAGFDTTSAQSFRRDSWATPHFSPNFSTSTAPSMPTAPSFNFVAPSAQTMHTMSMAPTSQYRTTPMSSGVEPTPEFPAHLTSMESSASEAELPNGSQSSLDRFLQKPASSASDSGTYSCTYHGCTQRFETPQKLQKHKREGHRSANLGSSMTSAAILDGNTQAGPHKCERINPTTGKPCNTIFSRPYDLTRHEDTIHNARKQKVRCALCVEEKTFSRNDALTRHMRVVHPEVDFPGKHRRRGGNHD